MVAVKRRDHSRMGAAMRQAIGRVRQGSVGLAAHDQACAPALLVLACGRWYVMVLTIYVDTLPAHLTSYPTARYDYRCVG
jgi:hypothetical protein